MTKLYKELNELYWIAADLEYKNPRKAKEIYLLIEEMQEKERR
jgi:hypothetical protein